MKGADRQNLYRLEGAVPLKDGFLFGFQHVLVMFLANLTPIVVVLELYSGKAGTINAIQSSLLLAGIGTIIQLFPIWRCGSGLPSVCGVSFTFIASMALTCELYGYYAMLGAVIVGGAFLIVIGIIAKYIRRFIKPIVSAIVVFGIGLGLIELGIEQIFSYSKVLSFITTEPAYYDFSYAWPFLVIAGLTLFTSIFWHGYVKGIYRSLSIVVGLIVGYIAAVFFNLGLPSYHILDFSSMSFSSFSDFIDIPHFVDLSKIEFNRQAIVFTCLIYLVAATEGIGDIIAIAHGGLNRTATEKEISGALIGDGIISIFSGLFGSLPLTSSSENVGLIAKTKVVNRFAILQGAILLIILSFLPQFSSFFETIPDAVLGGCMLLVYSSVLITGMQMISKAGFTSKNIIVLSLSISIGFGTSFLGSEFFNTSTFPGDWGFLASVMEIPEANMFALALVFSYLIPDDKETKAIDRTKQEILISSAKENEGGENEIDESLKKKAEANLNEPKDEAQNAQKEEKQTNGK
jgi:uracil-xanthine permease